MLFRSGGQPPRDLGRVDAPMEEEQLLPSLPQHRAPARVAARGEQAEGGVVHPRIFPARGLAVKRTAHFRGVNGAAAKSTW